MITTAVQFARSWVARWFEVQGVDRAMALAAQAFSALIPLMIVNSAIVSRAGGDDFADKLIDRFDLRGGTAQSVHEAFSSSQTLEDSISLLGLLVLIVSALSFTRGMQRLYEGAYRLPGLGFRNTPWGLMWLWLVVLYAAIRPVLAGLFDDEVLQAAMSFVLAAGVWTVSPYLLLGRRVHWKPLLPGAILTAIGMTALGVSSFVWFPPTIESSAEQFGVIGVAFALLSWLIAAAFVLVGAATGGAMVTERVRERAG